MVDNQLINISIKNFCYKIKGRQLINNKIKEELWRVGFNAYIKIEPKFDHENYKIFYCTIINDKLYHFFEPILIENNTNFNLFNIYHYDDLIRGVDQFYENTNICLYIISSDDLNKNNIKIEDKNYDYNLLKDFNTIPFEIVDNQI